MQLLPTYYLPKMVKNIRFNLNNWRYVFVIDGCLDRYNILSPISTHNEWVEINNAQRINRYTYASITNLHPSNRGKFH